MVESGEAPWLSNGYPVVFLPDSGEPYIISKFSPTFCSIFLLPIDAAALSSGCIQVLDVSPPFSGHVGELLSGQGRQQRKESASTR
jgi:hypothetical protein